MQVLLEGRYRKLFKSTHMGRLPLQKNEPPEDEHGLIRNFCEIRFAVMVQKSGQNRYAPEKRQAAMCISWEMRNM
jgi:hypothetical protein